VEREGWRKTRGGEERKGREQGEEREWEDKRREGRVKGPQDVWRIAAPVTYQFIRSVPMKRHMNGVYLKGRKNRRNRLL
jgi:hypothetical protein